MVSSADSTIRLRINGICKQDISNDLDWSYAWAVLRECGEWEISLPEEAPLLFSDASAQQYGTQPMWLELQLQASTGALVTRQLLVSH